MPDLDAIMRISVGFEEEIDSVVKKAKHQTTWIIYRCKHGNINRLVLTRSQGIVQRCTYTSATSCAWINKTQKKIKE